MAAGFSVEVAAGFSVEMAVGFSVEVAVGFSVEVAAGFSVEVLFPVMDPSTSVSLLFVSFALILVSCLELFFELFILISKCCAFELSGDCTFEL